MPVISIIVPCYNAERYLGECLESLRAQKNPEIEMIFIDDGSKDETGAMLDRFAATEPRAKVVHVKNGGVSAARNLGLSMAAGRYVAFIDADDLFEEGALLDLYEQAERTGAQIVSANHVIYDMEKDCRVPVAANTQEQPEEIAREIIHMHRIYNNLWNKLYDRALFEGISLDEGVRIGEDALMNLQLFLRARKTSHIEKDTYVYRVHSLSAMAGVKGHSQAHQPMLRSMSAILTKEGVKERYFRDFLQSCVWIDEKERGIRACMRRFDVHIRPLVMEGIREDAILTQDRKLYHLTKRGAFPAFYMLMRIREKITGKRWGIRR